MNSARFVVAACGLAISCLWAHAAISPSTPVTVTAAHATSGYAARLRSHAAWASFPVRLMFVHDANYSRRRAACAIAGFQKWNSATSGFVSAVVVNDPAQADIKVRFSPHDDNGFTTTRFRGTHLLKAHITIGVRQGEARDIEAVAAHEFGHALGIDGHSLNRHDLMYPYHFIGTPGEITSRDLSTLCGIYPTLLTHRALAPVDTATDDSDPACRV